MTNLQERALLAAPDGEWFVVSNLKGLGVALGPLGAAVRHMAQAGLFEKQWSERIQRYNKRVWAYRITAAGRKERNRLRATESH